MDHDNYTANARDGTEGERHHHDRNHHHVADGDRREAQEGVAKWLEGKERVKVVFVPDRLLNVVVK